MEYFFMFDIYQLLQCVAWRLGNSGQLEFVDYLNPNPDGWGRI
jgi:hypothetical protein